ncbi:MAG: hypothetical protein KBC11_00570 [Candidatus Pacebacteria bacterium]|nr:hypothetical protein [Candidatus Paceibacterota bacterium]
MKKDSGDSLQFNIFFYTTMIILVIWIIIEKPRAENARKESEQKKENVKQKSPLRAFFNTF